MLLKGGMRAVIWTDVFQCFAMLAGMLAVVIKVRSTNPVHYRYVTSYLTEKIIDLFVQKSYHQASCTFVCPSVPHTGF